MKEETQCEVKCTIAFLTHIQIHSTCRIAVFTVLIFLRLLFETEMNNVRLSCCLSDNAFGPLFTVYIVQYKFSHFRVRHACTPTIYSFFFVLSLLELAVYRHMFGIHRPLFYSLSLGLSIYVAYIHYPTSVLISAEVRSM